MIQLLALPSKWLENKFFKNKSKCWASSVREVDSMDAKDTLIYNTYTLLYNISKDRKQHSVCYCVPNGRVESVESVGAKTKCGSAPSAQHHYQQL